MKRKGSLISHSVVVAIAFLLLVFIVPAPAAASGLLKIEITGVALTSVGADLYDAAGILGLDRVGVTEITFADDDGSLGPALGSGITLSFLLDNIGMLTPSMTTSAGNFNHLDFGTVGTDAWALGFLFDSWVITTIGPSSYTATFNGTLDYLEEDFPYFDDVAEGQTVELKMSGSINYPEITSVPEPASLTLLGFGMLALAGLARRRN